MEGIPTARTPGGVRPDPEYDDFLDAGGELADLDSGDEEVAEKLDLATKRLRLVDQGHTDLYGYVSLTVKYVY